MITLIFLILMIVFIVKFNNAQKEINNLKQQLKQYTSEQNMQISIKEDVSINKIFTYEKIDTTNKENINPQKVTEENVIKIAKNSQKNKNTLILIAGAILIVLAAIVFLMSTWNTMPNVVKTGILVLLIGVFLETSYLADKKLKLNLTSKTFYYISMAYIPIVMFSISLFKLFGEYLSIFGEGKFLYFSVCTIVLSILYLIEVIKHNKKPLLCFSIITQVLTVIFTILIFSTSFYIIAFGILTYILIMYMISQYEGLDKTNFLCIRDIIPILHFAMSVITIFGTIPHWIMQSCGVIDILNIIVITITYYLMQRKNKYFKFAFDIGLLLNVLTIINLEKIVLDVNIEFFIITLSICLIYLSSYLQTHKLVYKTIIYIALNFLILSIFLIFNIENYIKYITFITTSIAVLIARIDRCEGEKYYLITSFGLTFFILNININIVSFICLLITIGIFIAYINNEKISQGFMAFPMLAIAPSLYSPIVDLLKPFYLNIIVSFILIIATTIKSILDKKDNNIYLFASITYILFSISSFKMNAYINLFLILLWAVVHAIFYEKKDAFKVIAYITGLVIYNRFFSDNNFISLTVINSIGYLLCIYLITRTVLKKHIKFYKFFEYICTSLLFLFALNNYSGITDAMIFIISLVAFVIIGYTKKVGPLFLISLISIVINIFKLTKDFWQSIPWWIYMLIVGSILISFAIKNEINEKEKRLKLGDIVRKLKENVDL